jgi:hypothetical protein
MGAPMLSTTINAVIFYQHDPAEVAGLSAAIIPLADHVKAVGSSSDRSKAKNILNGGFFRFRDASRMRTMLQRATRHARANLEDYFPYMRQGIMENAERLEVAVQIYWDELRHMVDEVMPTQ